MAALVLLEAKVKPGELEAAEEFLRSRLPETRAYDGCQGLTMYLSPDDGHTFVLVEYWDSIPHYERYLAWRQETGTLDEFSTMLESAPSIRYFEHRDV